MSRSKNNTHRSDTSLHKNVKEELRRTSRAKTKLILNNTDVEELDDQVFPTKKQHASDIWNWD